MFADEPVTVSRTSAVMLGSFDPSTDKLYTAPGVDVAIGDVLTIRGIPRRVLVPPEVWLGAGVVVTVEKLTPYLPDTGSLARQNGTVFDRTLNTEVPNWVQFWTGPCLVDPPTSAGSEAEAGQQLVTVQPFTVSVPLTVVDIRPGDRFTASASADPRLVNRPLLVTRTKGASLAQVREFTAIDNET